jgi:hypothetical protein
MVTKISLRMAMLTALKKATAGAFFLMKHALKIAGNE